MFFILSKLFAFFVHPLSWILILFFWAWKTRKPIRKKRLYISAIATFIFFSNTVIFSEVVRLWEPNGKKREQLDHYDIAVVLGGMAEYDNNLQRLSIRRGADRLWQALMLYKMGKVDKILVSGANGHLLPNKLDEANQFKEELILLGIPSTDILTETKSRNTWQNAVETHQLIHQKEEFDKVLLVTSALHMKRAEACFKKAGFKRFDTFTTDHYTGKKRGYAINQYLIPNFSNFEDWERFNHEWIGYFIYWMMGYV